MKNCLGSGGTGACFRRVSSFFCFLFLRFLRFQSLGDGETGACPGFAFLFFLFNLIGLTILGLLGITFLFLLGFWLRQLQVVLGGFWFLVFFHFFLSFL